jgi:hypothetical protein
MNFGNTPFEEVPLFGETVQCYVAQVDMVLITLPQHANGDWATDDRRRTAMRSHLHCNRYEIVIRLAFENQIQLYCVHPGIQKVRKCCTKLQTWICDVIRISDSHGFKNHQTY